MPSLSTLLAFLPTAALAASTTASIFLGYPDLAPTPTITGYVKAANPSAATYVIDCVNLLEQPMCGNALTITKGSSWESFSVVRNNTTVDASCTFTGTTEGACQTTWYQPNGQVVMSVRYLPLTAQRVPANVPASVPDVTATDTTFPGFVKMMVTSGAELLATLTTATTMSSSSSSAPLNASATTTVTTTKTTPLTTASSSSPTPSSASSAAVQSVAGLSGLGVGVIILTAVMAI